MQKKFDFDKLSSDYDLRTDIVKENTIIDDKFECSHGDVSLENEDTEIEHWFLRYLYKKGYA
ncbi:MAG: hypothetical protein K2O05_04070, partial [Anaeroplasmataceae bacterium]|nr:hypothetical protein [Anaeroplasmataceae bacterium]